MNFRCISNSARINALELPSNNTVTSKESTNDKRERGDMQIIECPICGTSCGKRYPSTETDPAFCEGIGENFSSSEAGFGVWCCSQDCLDKYNEGAMQ